MIRTTSKRAGRQAETAISYCTLREFDDDHNRMQIKTADVFKSESPTDVQRMQQAGMTVHPMRQDQQQGQQGQQGQDGQQGGGQGGGGGGESGGGEFPGNKSPWSNQQPKGESAEGVMLYLNGSRSHPVCISIDDARCRPYNIEEGGSFFYSVDHKNPQYGQYLRRKKDGKDGVYVIAMDLENQDQQGGGGGGGAGTQAAGGGQQKDDRISLAHVEKKKQDRKKGKKQQQAGGQGGGSDGGQSGQSGQSGGQKDYLHEGDSVNTEVRLTKKRIQFFKKTKDSGGAGAQAADGGGGAGGGKNRKDGELRGYWDNELTNWWWKADKDIQNETGQDYTVKADRHIDTQTKQDFKIKADGKTHFTAKEHVRIGNLKRQGNEYLSGIDVAADHVSGSVSVPPTGRAGEEIITGVSLLDVGARVTALESAAREGGVSKLNKLADIFVIDDAGNITVNGDLRVTGNLTVNGVITARDFVRS